jgi:hypothetical protein
MVEGREYRASPYPQISGGSFAGNHIGAKSCADIPQNRGNAPAHANKKSRSFTHLGPVHQSARVLFGRVQEGPKRASVEVKIVFLSIKCT